MYSPMHAFLCIYTLIWDMRHTVYLIQLTGIWQVLYVNPTKIFFPGNSPQALVYGDTLGFSCLLNKLVECCLCVDTMPEWAHCSVSWKQMKSQPWHTPGCILRITAQWLCSERTFPTRGKRYEGTKPKARNSFIQSNLLFSSCFIAICLLCLYLTFPQQFVTFKHVLNWVHSTTLCVCVCDN